METVVLYLLHSECVCNTAIMSCFHSRFVYFLLELYDIQEEPIRQRSKTSHKDHEAHGKTHYSGLQTVKHKHFCLKILPGAKELTSFFQESSYLLPQTQDVTLLTHSEHLSLVRNLIGDSTENVFVLFPTHNWSGPFGVTNICLSPSWWEQISWLQSIENMIKSGRQAGFLSHAVA